MNSLPEEHLLFAFHYLNKYEEEKWERLGAHLGTLWDRDRLMSLNAVTGGAGGENANIFVPLSLVVNPDLPAALLGEKKDGPSNSPQASSGRPPAGGDGLNTEMSIPTDSEVVNMADLTKDEFFGLIGNAGLATTTKS